MPKPNKEKESRLSHERLKELLHYYPEAGYFVWKASKGGSLSGSVAGCYDKKRQYLRVRIDGEEYLGHRLGWFYVNGVWPDKTIDHIDGNKLNNRLSNLRCVSQKENSRNQARRNTNKSGFNGVCPHKTTGRWRAYIMVDGLHMHLGLFDDKYSAARARELADIKYSFHDGHGSIR